MHIQLHFRKVMRAQHHTRACKCCEPCRCGHSRCSKQQIQVQTATLAARAMRSGREAQLSVLQL